MGCTKGSNALLGHQGVTFTNADAPRFEVADVGHDVAGIAGVAARISRQIGQIERLPHEKAMHAGAACDKQALQLWLNLQGRGKHKSPKTIPQIPRRAQSQEVRTKGGMELSGLSKFHSGLTARASPMVHNPEFMNFMTMGKNRTINVQGKMKAMRGNNIFTGASIASFSARKNLSDLR